MEKSGIHEKIPCSHPNQQTGADDTNQRLLDHDVALGLTDIVVNSSICRGNLH